VKAPRANRVQRPTNGASRHPSSGTAARHESLLEIVRTRAFDHPLIVLVLIVGAVLAFSGEGIRNARDVRSLFGGKHSPPVMRIAASDLSRDANALFGFSFSYPTTWKRTDAINGDGSTFMAPNQPGVELRVWGTRAPPSEGSGFGLLTFVASVDPTLNQRGSRMIENAPVDVDWVGVVHRRHVVTKVPGWRFVTTSRDEATGLNVTTLLVAARLDRRDALASCKAPTSQWQAYEQLCYQLVNGFHLTQLGPATSGNPTPEARR
jgi:hypothetical protein